MHLTIPTRRLIITILAAIVWAIGARSAQAQTNPSEMSHTRIGGECWDIELTNNVLYAACGPRVDMYNVTSPDQPTLVGSTDDFAQISNITVLDNRWLYAAGFDGILRIFDMVHPEAPVMRGQLSINVQSTVKTASIPPKRVAEVGEMSTDFVDGDSGGPASTAKLAELKVYSYDVEIAKVGTRNLLLSAEGDEGVKVYDLTNPTAPKLLGSFVLSSELLLDVAVHGTTAFVAVLFGDILVLDISDPINVKSKGMLHTEYTRHLDVYPTQNGLPARLITTSTGSSGNPAEIFDADSLKLLKTVGNGWNGALDGQYAYITTNHGLDIIDTASGQWTKFESAFLHELNAIELGGGFVFIASRATGLHIINVHEPLKPVLASAVLIPGDVEELSWPYAWGRRGIYKLGLAEDDTLLTRGYHFLEYVQDVKPSPDGQFVFACAPNTMWHTWAGLMVMDSSLNKLGGIEMPFGCMASSTINDLVYVTSFDGVRVIDVSDPAKPWVVEADLLDTPRTRDGSAIIADGRLLLVADEENGVTIYKTRKSPAPARRFGAFLPYLHCE